MSTCSTNHLDKGYAYISLKILFILHISFPLKEEEECVKLKEEKERRGKKLK